MNSNAIQWRPVLTFYNDATIVYDVYVPRSSTLFHSILVFVIFKPFLMLNWNIFFVLH
jgi:hypothetical protein